MATRKLGELANTLRSKNAGVNRVTIDVIFREGEVYQRVKKSGVLTRARVAELYGIGEERISHFVFFDAVNAVKITLCRTSPAGSPGDTDLLGCQQYAPLVELEIPWEE